MFLSLLSISMKRILALVILMMYSIANFGFGIHTHWCGGKVSSVNISFITKHTCDCCPKMEKSYCKNEFVYSKLSIEHFKSACSLIQDNNKFVTPFIITQQPDLFQLTFVQNDFSQYHAPPFKTKQNVFLTNRVFLI